jgi:hypothetical protein
MSESGRWLGLVLALAMLAFSSWIYLNSGDWVALVFAAGSLGYALVFVAARRGSRS